MPKLRMTCRDCGFCEHAPGMSRGLCWRPYDGPEIIPLESTGLCGYECDPSELQGEEFPRDLWLLFHKHPPEALTEVLMLLRLASAREAKEAK